MAQPVLLDTEIDLESKALGAFEARPGPRPVDPRESAPVTPRYPGAEPPSRWQRYSDWWAWGAALVAVASVVALFVLA